MTASPEKRYYTLQFVFSRDSDKERELNELHLSISPTNSSALASS